LDNFFRARCGRFRQVLTWGAIVARTEFAAAVKRRIGFWRNFEFLGRGAGGAGGALGRGLGFGGYRKSTSGGP